jgi:hypothetical protein
MISRTSKIQITTLSFLGALSAVIFATGGAQASVATDLQKCKYDTRQKTLNCCDHVLKTNKKPLWLRTSNGSCTSMVKCASGTSYRPAIAYLSKPKCYVQIPSEDNQGSGTTHTPTRSRLRNSFN